MILLVSSSRRTILLPDCITPAYLQLAQLLRPAPPRPLKQLGVHVEQRPAWVNGAGESTPEGEHELEGDWLMRFSHGESPHGSGTCRLCTGIASDRPHDPWNQPLLESQHFVAIPSLGALVEGWLLIVPKEHVLSVATLSDTRVEEMAALKQDVCDMVGREYGSVCVFEHGPASACRQTGCGVDHAHVHVVPLDVDLREVAERFLPHGVAFQAGTIQDCRSAAARGADYLYLEQPTGAGLVAVHDHFGSQVFRKAIAEVCGTPEAYNWRDHPQLRNVAATIERLGVRGASRLSQVRAGRAAAI